MGLLAALAGGVVLIAVVAFFLLRGNSAQKAQNKLIVDALTEVEKATYLRKTQIIEEEPDDGSLATDAVEALAPYPSAVAEDIEQIVTQYKSLARQVKQFGEQSVESTLQSSILTTRTMKMAEDIIERIKRVQVALNG